jgi:hypothetical protein
MLQNAVHPVQELRAVKTQADQHKTQTGKELSYDQYVNLLLFAASAYNAQFAPKTHFAARAPCRAVYSHDFTASNEDNDPAYDIDCALSIVQPKATHFAARTPCRVMYAHDIKESNDTTILPTISTAHSTSFRPMVHLAPAAWNFHSGHSSCLRMRKAFVTSFQTRQKTFSNSRVSRCRINQDDPGDWYLMAAYARHQHLLPFGNYMLYYFRRLVPPAGSIRSPPPTPIWKLHVTLFSRSFPREDGE